MNFSVPSSSNIVNDQGMGQPYIHFCQLPYDNLIKSDCNYVSGGSQQYNPHPGQVSISNFVSIKLSGETNYNLWKKQMMCLLEYHNMVGFIDGTIRYPKDDDDDAWMFEKWNKSKDTLVKGWIFRTLSEDVLATVLDLHNAYRVWEKLKNSYGNLKNSHSYDYPLRVMVEGAELFTEKEIGILEKDKVEAKYIPLQRAIVRGDWNKAQEFFNKDTSMLTAKINLLGDTPLHLAVYTCQNPEFIENLLKDVEPASLPNLEIFNQRINPLHHAAIVGYIEAAKMLVEKNPRLLFIADIDGCLPILTALRNYHEKTFRYLLKFSKLHIELSQNDGYQNPFEGTQGSLLLGTAISRGYLDIAYELICEYPNMAISKDETRTPLWYIVINQHLYFSSTPYNSYQRFIYSHIPIGKKISQIDNEISDIENPEKFSTKFITKCKRSRFYHAMKRIYVNIWEVTLLHVPHIKRLQKDKLKHKLALMILERICEEIGTINKAAEIYNQYCGAFNVAVLKDNHEAVETIITFFPDAIWTKNNHNYLPQTVAKYHCEMVLNFLEDLASRGFNLLWTTPPDKDENNILHLAGLLGPTEKLNVVSGAALQMQKEIQWFKRIEKCTHPYKTEARNEKGQTPIMVFREEHKNLRKEGEEWMKKTSDSYTITAAIIMTIVFAAAITVPRGNDQNTGEPIYITNASFIIFAISDAISLFTSTTSLLLFLSILTARYHEDDFLYKLPKRLILGLVMLFLSVTSLMVAFGATLYIMFGRGKEWILLPIATLACLPITSYVILQYPLLRELVSSTYGHGIYNKRNHRKNK